MNKIILKFGELQTFNGMTLTTSLIVKILQLWLSTPPLNNWQASRLEILKKSVIYVTSQDRNDPPHANGLATDISVWAIDTVSEKLEPSAFIIVIAGELSQYGFKCFVSTYNYHAHVEPNPAGGFFAETLYLNGIKAPPQLYLDDEIISKKGIRKIEPIAPELFNILILYKAFPSNINTDYVLAYIKGDKKKYDEYYRKIFPTGSGYIWNLTSMTPKETETFMKMLSKELGLPEIVIKIFGIAAGFILLLILLNLSKK